MSFDRATLPSPLTKRKPLADTRGACSSLRMAQFDLVIRNARVISSNADAHLDIGIKDGRIAALGEINDLATVIDAQGAIVTPGGVDVHAHIEQISGMGLMNADTFETATRSAAIGGTTTVVSFAPQAGSPTLASAVADYAARAERGAAIDHAFHIIVGNTATPNFADELTAVIQAGHRSIKIFTTYNIRLDDRGVCEVLSIAREAGALVCVHAENDGLIGWTKDRLLANGKHAPRFHAYSHPRMAEIEAVERLIRFAEFFATPVMLFHISTREAVDAIRAARARQVPVWAETCPHYLFMTNDVLDQPGIEAAKWMCSPPQRSADDQAALWDGLSDGTIDLISSDHAPYRFDGTGKLSNGKNVDFSKIANGMPGLETRMPLLFDAMQREQISPTEFVRLTATKPARIHGLPCKGDIAEGFDADLVIWDADRDVTFGANDLHDNVGYNPWEGRRIKGWPDKVILRGKVIVDGGSYSGKPGIGKWIDRPTLGVTTRAVPADEFTEATA